MISRAYISLAFALVPALCLSQTPNFEVVNRSVVKVRTHRDHPTEKEDEDETGTGFVVAAAGGVIRMVTAAHVVVDASRVEVIFNSDKVTPVPVRVLPQVSDNVDLAVLELRTAAGMRVPTQFAMLPWARGRVQVSQHVWTVNGDWEPVPNTVIRLDHTGNPQLFEYTQVSVGQGYSGAPVFSDDGLLLGIHLREASRSDYKLSVAVKMSSAIDNLDAVGYSRNTLNALREITGAPPQANAGPVKPNGGPQPGASPARPVLWRDLRNNQLYQIQVDSGHMYIRQTNGAVVADLTFGKNKKGLQGYFGNSSLSTCPGSGYMEITQVSETRVEGKIEMKPAAANTKCGGVFGMLRQLASIAFIREQ